MSSGGLQGRRILVPRGGEAGERWAAQIRRRGGVPVIAPLIETAPPTDPGPLVDAVAAWGRGAYDWVAITSPRGADAFAAAAAAGTRAGHVQEGGRIAAVGPATAQTLKAHGFTVSLTPAEDFSAVGLAAALLGAIPHPDHAATRVLLPLSAQADTVLETALRGAGHRVDRVDAYRTVAVSPAPNAKPEADIVLVSSGSIARSLAPSFPSQPASPRVVAIGDPTACALRELGLPVDAIATTHTIDGLLDAAARLIAEDSTPAHQSRSNCEENKRS